MELWLIFFFALDICTRYNAESPDEGALVDAARDLGFVLEERNFDTVTIQMPAANTNANGTDTEKTSVDIDANASTTQAKFKVLAINQFSSTRKRMSVLCECEDGTFVLLIKGADNVMVRCWCWKWHLGLALASSRHWRWICIAESMPCAYFDCLSQ